MTQTSKRFLVIGRVGGKSLHKAWIEDTTCERTWDLQLNAYGDAAAQIAAEQGVAGVTVQAVAVAAGVTKGGLFHHFPTKHALVEGMFADLLHRLDTEIDAAMAADAESHGRFTRAYVEAVFTGKAFGLETPWAAISMAMVTEPSLRDLWSVWVTERLEPVPAMVLPAMLTVMPVRS